MPIPVFRLIGWMSAVSCLRIANKNVYSVRIDIQFDAFSLRRSFRLTLFNIHLWINIHTYPLSHCFSVGCKANMLHLSPVSLVHSACLCWEKNICFKQKAITKYDEQYRKKSCDKNAFCLLLVLGFIILVDWLILVAINKFILIR